jgi:asparagine synthetase B (glutamine-hydrolysing)
VCLSGGLDSSGVAVLAREHFADLVAVSFDLRGPGRRASEDRRTAERLARELGLPLLDVTVTAEELLDTLDTVLVEGIDWRDFNVHAGLVNAALAEGITRAGAGGDGLVLTGDLANELLADYHAESYRGAVYYDLPRLDIGRLRAALVRGLDTSNRETGVFAAWGLAVAQPYAAAADLYLSLSPELLAAPQAKRHVAGAIFADRLPAYVYDRPKTRAQVGGAGAGGGVLGACVDRGIDRRVLRERFARLHGLDDERILERFLRAGTYRSAIPGLKEVTP